ncbi:MAG: protoheme IX farnesyltransferase [Hyphomicrobiales bacterium]|nr:protoheme IX farnesyltransferase [Hyphomicrobiales bacterium]
MQAGLTFRSAIMVFKPRIALAIMLSAIGGIAVTQGSTPGIGKLAMLSLAVFLAAGSAGAFNQWIEHDLDALMKRTANRPFVTGQFNAGMAWLTIILVVLSGSVLLAGFATNWWAALYTFLGAFTYGIVYTMWLKRRSWINIVVGGLAGSFAVLAGAAAVNPAIGLEGMALTLVLFLWTPPHFWSLAIASNDDYSRAGVPMLPVVLGQSRCAWVVLAHTVALALIAFIPAFYGMGTIYLIGAVIGGSIFTWTSIALVRQPGRDTALKNFFASLLQLCLLLGGAITELVIRGFS